MCAAHLTPLNLTVPASTQNLNNKANSSNNVTPPIILPSPISVETNHNQHIDVSLSHSINHAPSINPQLSNHRSDVTPAENYFRCFVPVVVEQYLSERHFRPLTHSVIKTMHGAVLFVDMSGFTPLAESLSSQGPIGIELLSQHLNYYFGSIIDIAQKYLGDVIKFAGDALMILFRTESHSGHNHNTGQQRNNNPDNDSDTSIRYQTLLACACALEIHNEFDGFEPCAGIRLRLHSAISSGELFGLHMGYQSRFEFLLKGKPIIDLTLAMHESKSGQIILHESAWNYVQHDILYTKIPCAENTAADCYELQTVIDDDSIQKQLELDSPNTYHYCTNQCREANSSTENAPLITPPSSAVEPPQNPAHSGRNNFPDVLSPTKVRSVDIFNKRLDFTRLSNAGPPTLKTFEDSPGMSTGYFPAAEFIGKANKAALNSPTFNLIDLESRALRCYLPSTVLSRVAAGHRAWLAEFRRVSTLFIKLPEQDFISGGDSQRKQAVHELQAIITLIMKITVNYRGDIRQLITDDKGTVIIVLFGLTANWANPSKAVRAALQIREEMHLLSYKVAIGITTGRVFCSTVGNLLRCEYVAIGAKVNLAARLMCAIKEDGILCDSDTIAAIGLNQTLVFNSSTIVQFESTAPLRLKGIAHPVQVYVPLLKLAETSAASSLADLGLNSAAGQATGSVDAAARLLLDVTPGFSGAMQLVDRKEEIAKIDCRIQDIINNSNTCSSQHLCNNQIIYIEGAAGLGKSVLLSHVYNKYKPTVCFLVGSASETETKPYYIMQSIIRTLLKQLYNEKYKESDTVERGSGSSTLPSTPNTSPWFSDPECLLIDEFLRDSGALQLLNELCPSCNFQFTQTESVENIEMQVSSLVKSNLSSNANAAALSTRSHTFNRTGSVPLLKRQLSLGALHMHEAPENSHAISSAAQLNINPLTPVNVASPLSLIRQSNQKQNSLPTPSSKLSQLKLQHRPSLSLIPPHSILNVGLRSPQTAQAELNSYNRRPSFDRSKQGKSIEIYNSSFIPHVLPVQKDRDINSANSATSPSSLSASPTDLISNTVKVTEEFKSNITAPSIAASTASSSTSSYTPITAINEANSNLLPPLQTSSLGLQKRNSLYLNSVINPISIGIVKSPITPDTAGHSASYNKATDSAVRQRRGSTLSFASNLTNANPNAGANNNGLHSSNLNATNKLRQVADLLVSLLKSLQHVKESNNSPQKHIGILLDNVQEIDSASLQLLLLLIQAVPKLILLAAGRGKGQNDKLCEFKQAILTEEVHADSDLIPATSPSFLSSPLPVTKPSNQPERRRSVDKAHADLEPLFIPLGPLPTASIHLLLKQTLNVSRCDEKFIELIMEKSSGIPLIAQELAKSLVQQQMIIKIQSPYKRRSSADKMNATRDDADYIVCIFNPAVPLNTIYSSVSENINEMVSQRIDSLNPALQLILKICSVFGNEINLLAIRAVLSALSHLYSNSVSNSNTDVNSNNNAAMLENNIRTLCELDFLRVTAHRGMIGKFNVAYMFKNGSIQQIIYNRLSFYYKVLIHTEIARWYENEYKENLQHFYSKLAYHYSQAALFNKNNNGTGNISGVLLHRSRSTEFNPYPRTNSGSSSVVHSPTSRDSISIASWANANDSLTSDTLVRLAVKYLYLSAEQAINSHANREGLASLSRAYDLITNYLTNSQRNATDYWKKREVEVLSLYAPALSATYGYWTSTHLFDRLYELCVELQFIAKYQAPTGSTNSPVSSSLTSLTNTSNSALFNSESSGDADSSNPDTNSELLNFIRLTFYSLRGLWHTIGFAGPKLAESQTVACRLLNIAQHTEAAVDQELLMSALAINILQNLMQNEYDKVIDYSAQLDAVYQYQVNNSSLEPLITIDPAVQSRSLSSLAYVFRLQFDFGMIQANSSYEWALNLNHLFSIQFSSIVINFCEFLLQCTLNLDCLTELLQCDPAALDPNLIRIHDFLLMYHELQSIVQHQNSTNQMQSNRLVINDKMNSAWDKYFQPLLQVYSSSADNLAANRMDDIHAVNFIFASIFAELLLQTKQFERGLVYCQLWESILRDKFPGNSSNLTNTNSVEDKLLYFYSDCLRYRALFLLLFNESGGTHSKAETKLISEQVVSGLDQSFHVAVQQNNKLIQFKALIDLINISKNKNFKHIQLPQLLINTGGAKLSEPSDAAKTTQGRSTALRGMMRRPSVDSQALSNHKLLNKTSELSIPTTRRRASLSILPSDTRFDALRAESAAVLNQDDCSSPSVSKNSLNFGSNLLRQGLLNLSQANNSAGTIAVMNATAAMQQNSRRASVIEHSVGNKLNVEGKPPTDRSRTGFNGSISEIPSYDKVRSVFIVENPAVQNHHNKDLNQMIMNNNECMTQYYNQLLSLYEEIQSENQKVKQFGVVDQAYHLLQEKGLIEVDSEAETAKLNDIDSAASEKPNLNHSYSFPALHSSVLNKSARMNGSVLLESDAEPFSPTDRAIVSPSP